MNERAFDRTRTDNLSDWDENFINGVDKPTLFRLIRASNTLEIKPLTMVASKRFLLLFFSCSSFSFFFFFLYVLVLILQMHHYQKKKKKKKFP